METVTVGGMTFEVISPSLMGVTWIGVATQESLNAMIDYAAAMRTTHGPGAAQGCVVDATQATGVDRRARKQIYEIGRAKPWQRVAFVGIHFEVRVLLELLAKALVLMNIDSAEIGFVDSHEQALAWLAPVVGTDTASS